MPLISIITAAYAPTADYLSETAASIEALELPPGWDLEWVVQEDGDRPQLAAVAGRYPFAQYAAAGRQFGTAIARNLALGRASGVLMQALDQDDVLLPSAFTTLIPRFREHRIHWAIGQADDLMPGGARRAYPSQIPFGLMRAGQVNKWAADAGGNWEVHGAAVMMRTASARALGGWAGLPGDDEISLLAGLSEITDGWYDEEITWLYRHHEKQQHRTPAAAELSAAARRICLQRARAVAATGLRFPAAAAAGFEIVDQDVTVASAAKDTRLPESARAAG
jgi:glycosyltransferase involved in cell wall biosynthesis